MFFVSDFVIEITESIKLCKKHKNLVVCYLTIHCVILLIEVGQNYTTTHRHDLCLDGIFNSWNLCKSLASDL